MKRNNKWLAAGAGVLISILFLWFAFRNLHLEQVWTAIQQINVVWLIPATIVFFISVVIIALRWRFLLRAIVPVPLDELTKLVLIGYMGNNVYPFRTGEILRIILLKRSHNVPLTTTTTTIVVERIFDGLTLLGFILVSLLFVNIQSPEIKSITTVATPLFLVATVVFFGLALRPDLLRNLLNFAARLLPGRLSELVVKLGDDFIKGLEGLRSPADLAGTVFASIGTWAVQGIVYWMVAAAFGMQLDYFVMLLVVGVVNLAGLVPASPGQIGVFEFFTGVVLVAVGVDQTQATAYALVAHVVIWLPATIAGFYYLIRHGLGLDAITQAQQLESRPV
jgi:glycosyltransferase 2 family protein